MTVGRQRGTLGAWAACAAAAATAALIGGVADAAASRSLQGTYTHHFTSGDFPNSEEPSGIYTMTITPSALIWTARGLGRPIEQIETKGRTLLVRDKPGSLGRLCAQNGWGTYRYTVKRRSVSFVKVKDPCRERGEVLGKTWTRRGR
jgi:hypothetical protein